MSKEDCTRLGDALLSAMASWANATPSDRNEHTTEVRDAIERFHDAIMSACGRATIKGLPDDLELRHRQNAPAAAEVPMEAVGNIADGEAVMAYSLRQLEAAMRLYEAAKAALDVLEVVGNAASFHNNNTPGVGQTVDYQDDHGSIRQQLRQQLQHFEEAMFPLKAVPHDATTAGHSPWCRDASGFYHCPKCGEPYSSLDGAQLCCDPDDCRPTAYRDLTPKD